MLDPACGSGNFLYLALLALEDISTPSRSRPRALGLALSSRASAPRRSRASSSTPTPPNGASDGRWIGEIQWMRRNGSDVRRNPILKPLDTIECRDAILNGDGTEAEWPAADVVIGNPRFSALSPRRRLLGDYEYTERYAARYDGRVPGGADLVCYWFSKAMTAHRGGGLNPSRAGGHELIRGAAIVLFTKRLCGPGASLTHGRMSPGYWTALAVRVSLICFGTLRRGP